MLNFFTSRHYSFFEKLKIVEKQLCKLNCSDGKVSHTLKTIKLKKFFYFIYKLENFKFHLIAFQKYLKFKYK